MRGSGALRDLREAASLSPALAARLQQAMATGTRSELLGVVDALIADWADTADFQTSVERANRLSDRKINALIALLGQDPYPAASERGDRLHYLIPGMTLDQLGGSQIGSGDGSLSSGGSPDPLLAAQHALTRKLLLLEHFNAQPFVDVGDDAILTGAGTLVHQADTTAGFGGVAYAMPSWALMLDPRQVDAIETAWASLVESVYAGLVLQTRLAPALDTLGITLDDGGLRLDTAGLEAWLDQRHAADPANALIDLLELRVHGRGLLTGWDDGGRTAEWIEAMGDQWDTLRAELGLTALQGGEAADLILGTRTGDVVLTHADADLVLGAGGGDRIETGEGDDTLYGGSGNDSLNGGLGSDAYHFTAGDGLDLINDYDSTAGNLDRVLFDGRSLADLVALERRGNDLVFEVGAGDRVTVGNHFTGASYRVEQFVFNDASLDDAAIKARVVTLGDASANFMTGYNDGQNRLFGLDGNDGLAGGAFADRIDGGSGNDTLNGYAGDDWMHGGAGEDRLVGSAGNDALLGGDGQDTVYGDAGSNLLLGGAGADLLTGGAGHEWLAGGAGDDQLQAGTGMDVLLFNRGDGVDTVYSAGSGADNALSLGGIAAGDLALRRDGDSLVLELGGGDAVCFEDWYDSPEHQGVVTLQMIAEAADGFHVGRYDFAGLVDRFDSEQPGVSRWALNEALLDFHLGSSDDAALGGDVAVAYALGCLPGMGLDVFAQAASAMSSAPGLQALHPWSPQTSGERLGG